MVLILVDARPFMLFETLAEALAYARDLSDGLRSRLTLSMYRGPALSR